ncbi:hypothetical protein [Lysinibacillus sp.]|uniref:hypothetical protein n=1 Tax=Lysinibacillus sp. TaxID=1869345 RepID=UPI00289D43B6|nr:hypothetical protein [Lysinibacillus sp.]
MQINYRSAILYIGGFLSSDGDWDYALHQHQLIKSYRSLLYGQLYIIQKPIERILLFQETGEQYTREQRAQLFELLYDAFADVANHTGGGLQMEPSIKEQYFGGFQYKERISSMLECLHRNENARKT